MILPSEWMQHWPLTRCPAEGSISRKGSQTGIGSTFFRAGSSSAQSVGTLVSAVKSTTSRGGLSFPWISLLLSRTNPSASELIPTTISIPPNDCAIINCKLLLIDHQDCHPANDSSFFRPLLDCRVNPPNDDSANLLT